VLILEEYIHDTLEQPCKSEDQCVWDEKQKEQQKILAAKQAGRVKERICYKPKSQEVWK